MNTGRTRCLCPDLAPYLERGPHVPPRAATGARPPGAGHVSWGRGWGAPLAASLGCSDLGERKVTGLRVPPLHTGLSQRSPPPRPAHCPGPARRPRPCFLAPRGPSPALRPAPPRVPPPARPGGGRSAGAERAHRGGGRSIRGADSPASQAWRRGTGRPGRGAGGGSGVARAGGGRLWRPNL